MPTDKQIEANRRNALRSTGPRSDSGKERSRYNGIQHGLYAEAAILPHEDRDEFEKLREALHADYLPATPAEQLLFDDLVLSYWRMRRAQLFLDVYLRQAISGSSRRSLAYDHPDDVLPILSEMLHTDRRILKIDTLTQMENRYRNAWYRAQKELRRLQQERLATEETPIEPEPLPGMPESAGPEPQAMPDPSRDPKPELHPEPSESSTAQPTENENQTQKLASVPKFTTEKRDSSTESLATASGLSFEISGRTTVSPAWTLPKLGFKIVQITAGEGATHVILKRA